MKDNGLNMIVDYVSDLAKKNSEALSFIPFPKLKAYAERGQLLIETENEDPCGFLVWGWGFPVLKIYQACIQHDARLQEHGINLVYRLIEIATARNCVAISLWCADDLEANQFWKSAGFIFTGQREEGKRRGRKHNHWILPLRSLLTPTPQRKKS